MGRNSYRIKDVAQRPCLEIMGLETGTSRLKWRLDNMAQGTVKWFNTQKGYGFINPDEEGNDVFVHITAVQNSGLNGLNEGQKVTYDLEEQRNGKMAAVGLAVIE